MTGGVLRIVLIWTSGLCLSGCGGARDEPARYRVSGTVTYDGRPIEHGMIYFDPAGAATGASGFAPIKGGAFDTAAEGGKGHIGGKQNVRINAYSPPTPDETVAAEPPPFEEEYITELELGESHSTQTIDVPKDIDKTATAKREAARRAAASQP